MYTLLAPPKAARERIIQKKRERKEKEDMRKRDKIKLMFLNVPPFTYSLLKKKNKMKVFARTKGRRYKKKTIIFLGRRYKRERGWKRGYPLGISVYFFFKKILIYLFPPGRSRPLLLSSSGLKKLQKFLLCFHFQSFSLWNFWEIYFYGQIVVRSKF